MAKFDDFDLDVTKTAAQGGIEPKYKSKSACTPGCPTGILMTCPLKTAQGGIEPKYKSKPSSQRQVLL